MELIALFHALADVFDTGTRIEQHAKLALRDARIEPSANVEPVALPQPIMEVMAAPDAHPVCGLIAQAPLQWEPPQTSDDPLYVAHSHFKVHAELVGPDGLAKSSQVRLGLYGMLPNSEYGLRTHPAEEVFIMLAGQADWKRAEAPYARHGPGERSYHPSMMQHATRTGAKAFLSAYVWVGDISKQGYKYAGLPDAAS